MAADAEKVLFHQEACVGLLEGNVFSSLLLCDSLLDNLIPSFLPQGPWWKAASCAGIIAVIHVCCYFPQQKHTSKCCRFFNMQISPAVNGSTGLPPCSQFLPYLSLQLHTIAVPVVQDCNYYSTLISILLALFSHHFQPWWLENEFCIWPTVSPWGNCGAQLMVCTCT